MSQTELEHTIQSLCADKADEFALYGYEHVTAEEIWQCVSEKYKGEWPPLYRMVNDILSLRVEKFMNWMTINAYKGIGLN